MIYGIQSRSFLNSLDQAFKYLATAVPSYANLFVLEPRNLLLQCNRKLSNNETSNATFYSQWVKLIRHSTIISNNHLTPEIRLHVITVDCELWTSDGTKSPFVDPFWAFYWPGGQSLSRFILDHPSTCKNRTVLDIGCGSGACGIAAALSNAAEVIVVDTDEVACIAAHLNAELNCVDLKIEQSNFIGRDVPFDCILVGDMFYDEEFASSLFNWLQYLHTCGKTVLIGDAGRLASMNIRGKELLKLLAVYILPENVKNEHEGLSTAQVWSM